MKTWIVDADAFLAMGDIVNFKKGSLITTNKIDLFLDDNNINFLIAPKGFGKTALLTYKRLLYKKKGTKFIPNYDLIAKPKRNAVTINWNELMLDVYHDSRNWEGLWRACISLSIIKKIKTSSIDAGHKIKEEYKKLEEIRMDEMGLKYPLLRRLIYEIELIGPYDFIDYIMTNFSRDEIISLLKEQEIIDYLIHEINTSIAIFIDGADELFEVNNISDKWIIDIEIWHKCQHGLMFAVKNMCRSNHHLKIFVSIRQEAYETINNPLLENIRGQCLFIHYSYAQLKRIFENNIKLMDGKYLIKPEKKNAQPIFSFLGFTEIINNSTGEEEDIFDYIYRHTLKRPRDIVFIGERIGYVDNEDRTIQNIQTVINTAAEDIAVNYINIFIPHTCFDNASEVKYLFELIPKNIMQLENLKDICSKFNGGCNDKCDKCDKKHIFCELYKLGLLGIVEYDYTTNKLKQKFLRPGEKTFGFHLSMINKHPDRDYYLIHPILNELISKRSEMRIDNTITIGDNKDWVEPKSLKTGGI